MSSNQHQRSLAAAIWVCACSSWAGAAMSAAAQTPPAPPPAAAPASAPPTAASAPEAPAAAAPTAPAEPPPADLPAPPPPVTSPPPPEQGLPPAPQYGQLGAQPEKPVQEGEWNPWDHPESEADSHAHEGFFLRLQIGPGGSTVSSERDESFGGFGLGMGLAIGGSVVPNLALHVDLQTSWLLSPSREVDGVEADFDANIALQSLGLGVTYHVPPVDIFVSTSFGIGRLAFETDEGETKETGPGFALNVMLGKEWWVGADWGIGVAGQLVYMNVEDYTQEADRLDAMAINVLFTATYN
jgi:hypothetical protein